MIIAFDSDNKIFLILVIKGALCTGRQFQACEGATGNADDGDLGRRPFDDHIHGLHAPCSALCEKIS